ncbi:MAG: S41 family peptidase, partial [Myxococcota bacterium]
YAELCELLIGPAESELSVQYSRGTADPKSQRSVTLTRTLLPEHAVYSVELPGEILYLRLAAFGPGAAQQLAAELWARPHQGVVLDLRHNPGGLVEEAVGLLDLFFEDGAIGGIAPRPGRAAEDYRARHQPSDVRSPVALLLDGGSASASELVAMVLQERERAVLLGAPSLGKGSVQRIIRMPGGGVLKVTNAHYIGAEGQRLDSGGVQPDRFLGPPSGETVLEGGDPAHDSWVLSAVDALEGGVRVGSQRMEPLVGPLP